MIFCLSAYAHSCLLLCSFLSLSNQNPHQANPRLSCCWSSSRGARSAPPTGTFPLLSVSPPSWTGVWVGGRGHLAPAAGVVFVAARTSSCYLDLILSGGLPSRPANRVNLSYPSLITGLWLSVRRENHGSKNYKKAPFGRLWSILSCSFLLPFNSRQTASNPSPSPEQPSTSFKSLQKDLQRPKHSSQEPALPSLPPRSLYI